MKLSIIILFHWGVRVCKLYVRACYFGISQTCAVECPSLLCVHLGSECLWKGGRDWVVTEREILCTLIPNLVFIFGYRQACNVLLFFLPVVDREPLFVSLLPLLVSCWLHHYSNYIQLPVTAALSLSIHAQLLSYKVDL